MHVEIEKASIKDLDKLYEIETKCFEKETITKQQIAYLLTNPKFVRLVAKINKEITGFIIGEICAEEPPATGHILTIDVLPKHRRKGIGLKLLQRLENILRDEGVKICFLEVREDNVAALSLYLKQGYRKIGKLENYYGNAHGICLKKNLT